jgi:hypothetical protein
MKRIATLAALSAAMLAGCSASPDARIADAPEALRPPAGEVMTLELQASGFQLYECTARPAAAAQYEWKFRGPEASLRDKTGAGKGRHYGGPTWEANDGSLVVAEVRASAPSPDAGAIPLLLLGSKLNSGSGAFGRVRSIQRLATHGGKAPSAACAQAEAGRIARVPYTAVYRFFEAA